jgi:peptidoglycan/xylan/chitin deacetylase (PgdA/CDA1 family)
MPRALALLLTIFAFPLFGDTPVATILCYHEVHAEGDVVSRTPRRSAATADVSESMRYVAHLDDFVAQLDYLEANGYHVIPLAHLVEYIQGKRDALPTRAVVITFDDGWLCTYSTAWPELKKRGMPFTFFIYPGLVVQHGSHTVKWDQIKQMASAGVDIESHSWSHPFLTLKNNHAVDAANYDAFLQHELLDSRTRLEKASGKDVRFFCYPYGDYDQTVIDAAARGGYVAATTVERGPIARSTPLMKLKRYLIHNDTTLDEFKTFLLR